jgi:hypothetical protein
LYSPRYPLKKTLWRFHQADVDDQISIPHGHSVDGNSSYVLNPYTGDLYQDNKIMQRGLSKKELDRLWSDEKFRRFVLKAREIYEGRNPDKPLPVVPSAKSVRIVRAVPKLRARTTARQQRRKPNELETYEVTLWTPISK